MKVDKSSKNKYADDLNFFMPDSTVITSLDRWMTKSIIAGYENIFRFLKRKKTNKTCGPDGPKKKKKKIFVKRFPTNNF